MKLDTVGPESVDECGIGCLTSRKNPGYGSKVTWLQKRFDEGLRYLLYRDDAGKPLAFLEYVPGEYAWRPVDAKGWLFVHCLWVYARGQKIGGLGSKLIAACVEEARRQRATGVAAMVSDGPWMSGKQIYLKKGFEEVAEVDRFQMVVHRLKKSRLPRFHDVSGNARKYRGLNVIYAPQCPMLHKSVTDLTEMAAEHGLKLKCKELKTAKEAQQAPSYYGVYSLVWNGRLLADHYVSKGRFRNILRTDILKDGGR